MTGKKATLTIGDKSIDLPIYSGTLGPDVIDIKDVLSTVISPTIQVSWRHLPANRKLRLLMATKVCYCIVVIRLTN